MNTLIEIGTNYGNIIELGLAGIFAAIIVGTTYAAIKGA